jgi:site-specific DNA-methyltransferase (adenine-specific)
MIDKTKVYNLDCMEGMRQFPDQYFELAIIDAPYGINGDSHRQNQSRGKLAKSKKYHAALWDQPAPNEMYYEELSRVSINQIIWGGNHFGNMPASSCWIVWDKLNRTTDFADCELAWTSFDTAVRKFSYNWNGMWQEDMKNKEVRIHPTQKPVALYKWLLKNYAKEGDKILDTHLGSGSSRIAAYDMGFQFWGYELDSDYFNAQEKRFQQHKAQLKLFEYSR